MNFNHPFWPRHHFVFKVGGVFLPDPIFGKVFLDDKKSNAGAAIDAVPVPTPAKPISPANPQVQAAKDDYADANLLKKSIKKTIIAGDTGGFQSTAPNVANQQAPISSYKGRY